MLPSDIENLINSYRLDFEIVDRQIQDAIMSYHTIEGRANKLIEEVEDMGLGDYLVKNIKTCITRTVNQSSLIVSNILENEEIHMCQIEMLKALNTEILYNIFNVLLHPFSVPGYF